MTRWLMVSMVVLTTLATGVGRARGGEGGMVIVEVRDADTLATLTGVTVRDNATGVTRTTDGRGRATFDTASASTCVSVSLGDRMGSGCGGRSATEPVMLLAVMLGRVPPAQAMPQRIRRSFTREWMLHRADVTNATPLDARMDPARARVELDGVRRLHGAPAIPLAWLDELELIGNDVLARATSGRGANDWHEGYRLQGGKDLAADARISGALKHDKVWAALAGSIDHTAGIARGGGMATVLATVDDWTSSLTAVALTGDDTGASLASDGLAAIWRSEVKSDGRLTTLGWTFAHERLTLAGNDTTRASGAATLSRRIELLGWHEAAISVGGGGGKDVTPDGTAEHRDLDVGITESWSPQPNITLRASLGYAQRKFADASIHRWLPTLRAAWDPSEAGRSLIFVELRQRSRLDDGALGAWQAVPATDACLATGVSKELFDGVVAGTVLRVVQPEGRRERLTVEGSLAMRRPHKQLTLTAASLERAVNLAGSIDGKLRRRAFTMLGRVGLRDDVIDWAVGVGHLRALGPYGLQLTAEVLGRDDDIEARLVVSLNR